jgi:hypothetical protein
VSQTDPLAESNALDEARDAIYLRAHKLTRPSDLAGLVAQADKLLAQLRRQPSLIQAAIAAIDDRFMLCLLLDHGLHTSELAGDRPRSPQRTDLLLPAQGRQDADVQSQPGRARRSARLHATRQAVVAGAPTCYTGNET